MATLTVTETHDYRVSGFIPHIDRIEFPDFGESFTATFGSDQFEGFGAISSTVTLDGGEIVPEDTIRVILSAAGSFSAAGWTVAVRTDFTRPVNVVLVGTSGTDTLTGSIFKDRSEEHTSELQSRLHLVCR